MFITYYNEPNRLYRNDGNLNFVDVTESVGLPMNRTRTTGANFGDYDLDGFLDLYITNFGEQATADTNSLYRNIGGDFFKDVTIETNTADYCDPVTAGSLCNDFPGRQSYCSIFFDFDLDGDQDLYISNDREDFSNSLLLNNDGVFKDVSAFTQSNIRIFSMNTGFADCNGDGWYDLYCTNIGPSSHLLWDPRIEKFVEVGEDLGTQLNSTGWGGNFFDADLDGDQDLYGCSQSTNFSSPNTLYIKNGQGVYHAPERYKGGLAGIDHIPSFSNAIGDIDHDGIPEIAVSHAGDDNFFLFKSCEANSNNYVKLDLEGKFSNTDAIGARIEVFTPNTYQITQKVSHQAYLAQNSDIINIGLGVECQIDSVVITWPYPNSRDVYTNLILNELNTLIESEGVQPGDDPVDCFPGTLCCDGDDCTIGETFDVDCKCSGGVKTDQDGDGYCSVFDPNDEDPCIPNAARCLLESVHAINSDPFSDESSISRSGNSKFLEFDVHPNPVKQGRNLHINLNSLNEQVSILIWDLYGNSIYSESEIDSNIDHFKISTKSFEIGTYFINVQTDKGRKTDKFFILD